MQEGDGAAAFAANLLDVNPVSISDVEHARVKRTEGFGQRFHSLIAHTEIRRGQATAAP
jgi:hypothetical protein